MSEFIKPFDPDQENCAQRWSKWINRFKLFISVKKITDEPEKINNLLYYGGEHVYDAYELVKNPTNDRTLDDVIDKLNKIFNPVANHGINALKFRCTKQYEEEKFDEYLDRLRAISKSCNFANENFELKNQIIYGCFSDKLKVRALEDETITLENLIKLAKTIEMVDNHMLELKKHADPVERELVNQFSNCSMRGNKQNFKSDKPIGQCWRCGGNFPHDQDKVCPAIEQNCNFCKKRGHFEKCCRSKKNTYTNNNDSRKQKVNIVRKFLAKYESGDEGDDQVWSLQNENSKIPIIKLNVGQNLVNFTIDTGATVNIMDERTFNELSVKPRITQSAVKLYAYGNANPLKIIGQFKTRVLVRGIYRSINIQLLQGSGGNVLGFETLTNLGLIKLVNQISRNEEDDFKDVIKQKYPNLCSGRIGKLNTQEIKLHINKSIKPIFQRARAIPLHLRPGIEKAIKKMIDNDIIEEVNGPTPWVSPIVPVIKENGEVRVCTDARCLNTAIQREIHSAPLIDEVALELNEAKFISKLDLNAAYNQLVLDEESRNITVFATHMGTFRYKRLNFGIKSAAEIFQKTIENILHGLKNCRNLSDDIIIYGKTLDEHDVALFAILKRLEEAGLTLNIEKCKFRQVEIDFFGLHFSQAGISLIQSKIDAILNAETPKDAKQLKSLCGLLNYGAKFIQNAASNTSIFQELLKKNARWNWTKEHEEALLKIKELLTTTAMSYFKKDWCTVLTTDASPTGLGAVLSQYDPKVPEVKKIILYASRALTIVEKKYAQIEREALAIVWACERLKLYLIGQEFELVTDNKAIQLIFNNPRSN